MNNSRWISKINIFNRVKTQDKINFARHLSIVVKAGLPILEGLRMIKRQTPSRSLSSIIEQLIVDVSNGQFLAASMERFPHVFNSFFVNIVRVGEASGTLADNLLYLSSELKKTRDLKNKIRSAMIYPIIVMIATVVLVSFLIFFAFPKILPILSSLNVPLPLPTKILMVISQFLIDNGLYVIIGLVIFGILMRLLLFLDSVRFILHLTIFFIPVLSRLTIDINMANFTRVLSVLLRGGIKIVEAVTITAQTFDNLVYRKALMQAAEDIRRGEQLAQFLSVHKNIFPMLISGLIEIGENTGNLEDNLNYLSEYYQDESEMSIKNLTTLIEPLLLLTMGLVVGFVAISIITPIYSITRGIGT
ncbi:MAG: type II secretion system F family protein [Patescibacteria group bacterium]